MTDMTFSTSSRHPSSGPTGLRALLLAYRWRWWRVGIWLAFVGGASALAQIFGDSHVHHWFW